MRQFDLVLLIGLIAGTASLSFYRSNRQPAEVSAPVPGPVSFPIPQLQDSVKPPLLNAKLSRSSVAVNGVCLGMTRTEVVQLLGKPERAVVLPSYPDKEICTWQTPSSLFIVLDKGVVKYAHGNLLTILHENDDIEIVSSEAQLGAPQQVHHTMTNRIPCWEGIGIAVECENHDSSVWRCSKIRIFAPKDRPHTGIRDEKL